MEVFKLAIDEKVTVWRRSIIEVEATSLEEAIAKAREDGSGAGKFIDSEYIYETEEYLKPNQSYEFPVTLEIMDEHYNTIASNESPS